MMKKTTVLGIETSCDDTSICILRGDNESVDILSHKSFSQETLLKKWGGVVPEIASRNHLQKLVPLMEETFKEAKIEPSGIDLIGVTTNPGLLGPLLTGLNAAKTLAIFLKCPIVPVNHLFAHLEAVHITEENNIGYPYVGLLVSGGHSIYFLVKSPTSFEILGSTLDDAAGEAFDKGGKILGLGYPAGKIIDDMAKFGDNTRYEFPIGLKSSGDANLSYSGVKTSLRYFVEKNPLDSFSEKDLSDVCASYQHAIVSALKLKLKWALKNNGLNHLPNVVGGGVACNSYLREQLKKSFKNVYFVEPKYCTDNGAMVANYALRTKDTAVSFPECLYLDARGRYISKQDRLKKARTKKNQEGPAVE